jgi:hypothetical protein
MHQFLGDLHVRLCSDGCHVVKDYRLTKTRRFRESHISRDHGVENAGAEVLARIGRNLA